MVECITVLVVSGCLSIVSGRLTGVFFLLVAFLFFSVRADASLQKDVLTCSQVSLSLWKIKYLSDTESKPGLSSEDEAVGMPLHKAVARRLPGYQGAAPVQTSTSTQSTSVGPSGDVSDPGGEPDILEPPFVQPAAGEYRAALTF